MLSIAQSTSAQNWFGSAFEQLHPQLQALHRDGGTLHGAVDVGFGSGIGRVVGKVLAHRLGVPAPNPGNTLEVTICNDAQGLHWNRRFNHGSAFRSLFTPVGVFPSGHWLERSGFITLALQVKIVNGGWHWQLMRSSVFGVSLPRWAVPRTIAYKEIVQGRYHFSVEIVLPLLGKVLSYRGNLELKPTSAHSIDSLD